MPNTDKSRLIGKNSTDTAPVFEWKRLYRRELAKAHFSETSELYQVTIDGEYWDSSEQRRVRTCVTDLYTEYHPYMAIGRAVIAFMEASAQSRIHDIRICKQVEKKTRKK